MDTAAETVTATGSDARLDQVSPMADLPGGTGFGSLVHTVFEHADPAGADLTPFVSQAMRQHGLDPAGAAEVAAALLPGLRTPLGPAAGSRCLAEIPARDRLAELGFELALAPAGTGATLSRLAEVMAAHLPGDDPLASYPERLRDPDLDHRPLRGFLSGSIDAVLRLDGRHLVVDYKTNRLGPPDAPLTLRSYTPARLAEAMMASHYPLQALFYSVALHRFLRWRLPGYDPGRHLGGVYYLFVRGMAGPDTPTFDGVPCGVFHWRPPARLVTELSDLLAGGRP